MPNDERPHLLVHELVHDLEALDGLLLGDADVLLLERHGPVRVVEVEEAAREVDAQEQRHVLVVGQGGGEADEAHVLLGGLHVAQGARHYALEHGPPLVVQQVDLVDDDEAHELRVGAVAALPRDYVPLLGRAHDHLGLGFIRS